LSPTVLGIQRSLVAGQGASRAKARAVDSRFSSATSSSCWSRCDKRRSVPFVSRESAVQRLQAARAGLGDTGCTVETLALSSLPRMSAAGLNSPYRCQCSVVYTRFGCSRSAHTRFSHIAMISLHPWPTAGAPCSFLLWRFPAGTARLEPEQALLVQREGTHRLVKQLSSHSSRRRLGSVLTSRTDWYRSTALVSSSSDTIHAGIVLFRMNPAATTMFQLSGCKSLTARWNLI
jgi:hypothetical protein